MLLAVELLWRFEVMFSYRVCYLTGGFLVVENVMLFLMWACF